MNYPNRNKSDVINQDLKKRNSKLGMDLEEDINISNKYYLYKDIAVVHKKPTPIKITKVKYQKRSAAKIVEAFFKDPSTTDYNGIYKGKYIDFEAKECHSKTSFPFTSISTHQIKHLEKVQNHGAISFIILKMAYYNETYLIKSQDFIKYYSKEKRKSLPYEWINRTGYLIKGKYTNPCDYISTIDIAYKKEFIK